MSDEKLKIDAITVEYLHQLRKSGAVNMLGAAPYLERDLGLSKAEAQKITLAYLFGDFTKGL